MTRPTAPRLRVVPGEGNGSGPRTGIWLFPDRPAPELVRLIVLAEELGLDEVWVGDEGPAREPFTVLAAAALATSRIRLAVGVTNPYVRAPALVATTMLTVHELSGGRAVLGVGAGGSLSLAPFEMRADRPVEHIRRFLEVADAVAEGRPAPGYHPTATAIRSAGPPVPIFVGARGPRLNQLASELADGAFVSGLPPFRYREVIGWARSVRPIEIALYPSVAFGPEAREHLRPDLVHALADSPAGVRSRLGVSEVDLGAALEALAAGDREPARALVTDSLQEQLMLVGGPDDVGQRLAALVREHQPESIGLAITQRDMEDGLRQAARTLSVMKRLAV